MQNQPLISCLCITHNRVHFLKRAIECFNAQTYTNKELVIVHKNNDPATIGFLEGINQENIIGYQVMHDDSKLLGDVRNDAIDFCNGEYFCNWDDDDWYSDTRLEIQYNNVGKNHQKATFLTSVILYDELNEQAYLSMFRMWEMTILCKKSEINEEIRYGSSQRLEDTYLFNKLLANSRIIPTVEPNLFIYFIHGKNTMNRAHFDKMFKMSQKLSGYCSKIVKEILRGKYSIKEGSELLRSEAFLNSFNLFTKKTNYFMFPVWHGKRGPEILRNRAEMVKNMNIAKAKVGS